MNQNGPYQQQPPQQQYPQQPGYGPPQGYGPPPGYPQQPPPKQGMSAGKIVAIVFGVLVLLALIGSAEKKTGDAGSATTDNASVGSPAGKPAEKPTSGSASAKKVALAELLGEYKDNELRADSSYKGQWVEVTGKVGDTKRDLLNDIYVTIGTGKQFEIPQIQCFFEEKQASAVTSLTKGQTITVRGKVDGLMMNVLVKKCEIVP